MDTITRYVLVGRRSLRGIATVDWSLSGVDWTALKRRLSATVHRAMNIGDQKYRLEDESFT